MKKKQQMAQTVESTMNVMMTANADAGDERFGGIPPPKKKAKLSKTELYKPPTSDEINQLKETENLFPVQPAPDAGRCPHLCTVKVNVFLTVQKLAFDHT